MVYIHTYIYIYMVYIHTYIYIYMVYIYISILTMVHKPTNITGGAQLVAGGHHLAEMEEPPLF